MSTMPPGDGNPPPPPPPPGQPYPSYPASPAYPSAPYYPSAGSGYAEPGPAPGYAYASFGTRFLGWVIDSAITFVIGLAFAVPLVYVPVAQYYQAHPLASGQSFTIPHDLYGRFILSGYIGAVIGVVYWGAQVAWFGRTLGQRAIGASVVRAEDGGKLPASRAFLRSAFFWGPSAFGAIPGVGLLAYIAVFVSFLAVAWDKQKQGWHDKLARSLVVKPWT